MVRMNLFAGQQGRNRHREQNYGHEGVEREEGERYGESNMETYITICKICKIDSQWNFLYGSGNSNELCINLEGWDGEGDGREVQEGGDICIPMADSC